MRTLLAVFAMGLLAGCKPGDIVFDGTDMVPYFPFDGQRTWEYVSTDVEISYFQVAQMRSLEPDVIDGVNVYPVDYLVDCQGNDPDCVEGDFIRSISWASDEIDGVMIYEWTEGTAAPVVFDPPLKIAETQMKNQDTVVTETAGATWTATLVAFEGADLCPYEINVDLGQCAHIQLDDGDDNPQTGVGLVGDYWAAVGYNLVGIQLVGDSGVWEARKADCTPEEECDGRW